MNRIVSFRRMEDGTREDYELLDELEREFTHRLPDRLLASLHRLDNSLTGYPVSRLEHSLQAATRALEDGADDELIVAALIHERAGGRLQRMLEAAHRISRKRIIEPLQRCQ